MEMWTLVILVFSVSLSSAREDMNYQVFSMSHLRDHAFELSKEDNLTWIASKHTLLILYEPRCRNEKYLEKFKMLPEHMPHPRIMTYVQHDYQTFPEKIWYSRDGEDVKQVFSIQRCPTAVFFHKGNLLESFDTWYSNKDKTTFSTWFWEMLKTDISVETQFDKQVVITFIGPGPQIQPETFGKGSNGNLITYIGYYMLITIKGSNDMLYAQLIDSNIPKDKITISPEAEPIAKLSEWKETAEAEQHEYLMELHKQQLKLQSMYIRTYKQPLLLGYFTDSGHNAPTVAHALFAQLVKYWEVNKNSNESQITSGNRSEFDPWLYVRDDNVQVLPLSKSKSNSVGLELHRLVEEWLNIPVELVRVNQIISLSSGSYIRPHVGRADEPLTAMIILDTGDSDEEDTEIHFEVMDYETGRAQAVLVEVGTVFLYESATLVLSSLQPLRKGQCLTILTAIFRPVNEWIWAVPKNNMYVKMGPKYSIKEPFDQFYQQILTGQRPEKLDPSTFTGEPDPMFKQLREQFQEEEEEDEKREVDHEESKQQETGDLTDEGTAEQEETEPNDEGIIIPEVIVETGSNHDEL